MTSEAPERFLVIGVNWVGDAVMSLPALQFLRQENPDAEITVLTKPNLAALWKMCPSVDEVYCFGKKQQAATQLLPTIGPEVFRKCFSYSRKEAPLAGAAKIRQQKFDRAYILPNSFRSAFIPFMAGIPRRIGARGHWRRMMLTEIVHLGSGHQQFEAMTVLGVHGNPEPPALDVPPESFQTLERKLTHFSLEQSERGSANAGQRPKGEANLACPEGTRRGKTLTSLFQTLETEKPIGARPVVTLLPGAARGPSKRWPVEQFALLAKNLCSSLKAVVLLGGGPDEAELCAEIEAEGYDIINLAGQTTFSEWAAMLAASDCVVANDSGGMHLAGAVGTPVVGLYDLADAEKTGPLGKHIVLQKKEATCAVAAIGADEVYGAVEKLLSCRR